MTDVWVTGFEESSFFLGSTTIPDSNDVRRYRLELEVDGKQVEKLARQKVDHTPYRAFILTFAGRRTRYPVAIDCYGGQYYVFVAHHIEAATYRGPMRHPYLQPRLSEREPLEPFKRSGEGGVIAAMEEEALASCAPG